MTILKALGQRLKYDAEKPFIERIYSAYILTINSLTFKALNMGNGRNEISISRNINLKVHDQSYYAFRYFTDLNDEMVEEMRTFLKLTQASKCFIDVGAHYGIFSLAFSARPDSVAHSFEPSPDAFKVLKHNIMVNPGHLVHPYPFAVNSSDNKLNLYPDVADHCIVSPKRDSFVSDSCITVDAIRLDTFVLTQKIKPDVIKIDVEGYEMDVLRGAKRLLSDYSPLIFLEIHPDELRDNGQTVEQVLSFLTNLNYIFFNHKGTRLSSNSLIETVQVSRIVCRKKV
ncbi:MAG: FkbM family methyltransferase [Leptolyngbyaceae cyanobacterium MO_188.B28]|nr:FkbM family methyltransferase [Leptolyngbyaceae cyanobacterium MO_188.B28]